MERQNIKKEDKTIDSTNYFLVQKEEHKVGGNTQIDCGPGALEILILSTDSKPSVGGLT